MIYICYRYDDEKWKNDLISTMLNPNTPIKELPIIDRENLKGSPREDIKNYLNALFDDATKMLILLGNHTHNGYFVRYEINIAISRGIPIGIIRIPETRGGLPSILDKNKYEIMDWNVEKINNLLENL